MSLIILVTTATSSNKTAEENLGLAYLASVCRKNEFEVVIIDGWLEGLSSDEIIERIHSERIPLFIGFSCNQLNGDTAIDIVKELKNKKYNVPFVSGGFAPTFNPQKFLDAGFDFVSLAEGEETILNLCNYFTLGEPHLTKISGLCYYNDSNDFCYNKPRIISEIDKLPFPSRDTMKYAVKEKTPVNIVTSRGCMAHCMFCSVSAFWKLCDSEKWRGRSVKNIVDEIESLYVQGITHFKIVDDSFIEPPRDEEWCNNFADEIVNRGLNIKLRITLRADRVTEGIIESLTRAGCNLYACGVENFSNAALKRMGKRANLEDNIRALDIFKKFNVYVQMGFILFDYGTTFSEIKENYYMMKKYSWTICRGIFSEMYAARGTPYTELLQRKRLIKGDIHLENYYYDIPDSRVELVYDAIKTWHISHMRMYNMVIEPINKPKVLEDDNLFEFYKLYQKIRERDLNFMGKVIELVENNVSKSDLDNYVVESIKECEQWFKLYECEVNELFKLSDITYNAEDDPFTQ